MQQAHPKLTYNNLGRSGLKISKFAFGNWVNDEANEDAQATANKLVKAAWDAGINFFDTAELYGAGDGERQMGNAVRALGVPRSDYVITTKIFFGKFPDNTNAVNNMGTSRKRLIEGLDRSLKNLQLDYVDVLFCHRYDDDTPTREVVETMKELIAQGKILYWGTSTWPGARVIEAILLADILGCPRPIAEQCQYNMLVRGPVEKEYVESIDDYGLGTTTWSPLCSGILTGKYNEGIPEGSRFSKENQASWVRELFLGGNKREALVPKLVKLGEIATRLGCTQAQLAIAWVALSKDVSTVLIGARTLKQLEDNLGALDVLEKLTPEIQAEIETILDNRPDRGLHFRNNAPLPPRR